jgi:hypothetical protein
MSARFQIHPWQYELLSALELNQYLRQLLGGEPE